MRANLRPSAGSAATVAAELRRGWGWGRSGWEQVRGNLPLWIGMSCLYLVPAALLARLPFAGPLLVLLLSPMLLAGVLLAAERGGVRPDKDTAYERWLARPRRALVAALVDEVHIYPAILLGIITLGLVVLLFIVEHLFGFGSFSGVFGPAARNAPWWAIALGLVGAVILHALLAMGLLYAVHRTVLAGRDPIAAVGDSLAACTRHPAAALALVALYAIPYLAIVLAFSLSALLGYLLLFTVGVFALPIFVAASLVSYRDLFAVRA